MDGFFQIAIRALAALAACVALAGLAGAVYQYVSEMADFERYPAPGRLVNVGGRRLHLLCAGSAASPTVVIEAGSGDYSEHWDDMVQRVSVFAHVCTYDRAGLGWSDPAPVARTIDDRAADLHALLTAANVPAPYVLVGHSYGGYIVRRFAAAHPDRVAGVVLIDAPEEEVSFAPGLPDDGVRSQEWRLGWMTRLGLVRLGVALFPDRFDPVRGVPAGVHGLMTALALRTSRGFTRSDEMASYREVPLASRRAHGFGLLGHTPLVVVSRGLATFPEWQDGQMRLTQLSTASTHVVAERSGHAIQFSEPDVISAAIRRVLADVAKDARG